MTKDPIALIKMVIRFLTIDVWKLTADNVSGTLKYLINVIKALFLSIRFFLNDRMMEKASALTYYTLLAIVPLFALILGIAKGFNVQDMLVQTLANNNGGANDATVHYLFTFANSYLEHSKTSVIMGIGIVMLLWVIYSLIGNIEAVFNTIWQQKKSRNVTRKVTVYLSITLVIPILIFFVCGLQVFSHTAMHSRFMVGIISETVRMLFKLLPYLLIIIVFTLIYMVIPNAKVKFTNALIAGAVAGSVFIAFQNLYLNGQIWVSKYNAIYGSFAALPLLLLWLQMSWVICLYGAELSFAAQNMRDFEFEKDTKNISKRYYLFLCIVVARLIYSEFPTKKYTTEAIAETLHLPSKLTAQIVLHLRELEVICETIDINGKEDEHNWQPGKLPDQYTFGQLLKDIRCNGSEDFNYDYTKIFDKEWSIFSEMKDAEYAIGSQHLVRDQKFDLKTIEEKCNSFRSQRATLKQLFSRENDSEQTI